MKTIPKNLGPNGRFGGRCIVQLSLLLAAGVFLSACKSQETARVDAPDGSYTLVAVNDLELPAKVAHGESAVEVRSGRFLFKPGATCESRTVFLPPSGEEVVRNVKASYQLKGEEIVMKWEGAGTTVGTLQGNTFTMNNEGMVFRYRK